MFCLLGFKGECDLVPRKQMDALILQYQLLDQYKALKHELEATQEENKQLKEQLGRSNFRFDSIKNEGYKGEVELLDDFVNSVFRSHQYEDLYSSDYKRRNGGCEILIGRQGKEPLQQSSMFVCIVFSHAFLLLLLLLCYKPVGVL